MAVPLQDIADRSGYSKATVSRVLNDRPGVSEAAKQAVWTALDVLNIERPDRLRSRGAGLVGLVVPELDNPVFPLFAQVISANLSRERYTPVLCAQAPDGPREDEYVAMLRDHGVSGILFVSGLHTDPALGTARYTSLVDQRLPIVLINGYLDGVNAPFLSADDEVASTLAVDHLVKLGHRRIGLAVTDTRLTPAARRVIGFRSAITRHLGEAAVLPAMETFDGIDGGYAVAQKVLAQDLTAVVCCSDLIALGLIHALRQRGLTVPEHLSVIGADDSILMNHTGPPLTTVRQPVLRLGRQAALMLIDEIRGRPGPRGESLFQPELVIRDSTGPAPAP